MQNKCVFFFLRLVGNISTAFVLASYKTFLLIAVYTCLTVSTLKLPSAKEKPWFSVRGSPKLNVRTESVRVRRRAMTKSSAHRVKLRGNSKKRKKETEPQVVFLFSGQRCRPHGAKVIIAETDLVNTLSACSRH